MAVNQLDGVTFDGDNGKFIEGLGKREANYFHIATPGGIRVEGVALSGINRDNKALVEGAWKKWKQLPLTDRQPPNFHVDETPPANAVLPPEDGLVLRVFTRNLKGTAAKGYSCIARQDLRDQLTYSDPSWLWAGGIYTEPMPDVMWIRQDEWKSLIPDLPKKGDRLDLPAPIKMRMLRYHMIDGTFGLPFAWKLVDVKRSDMSLVVDEVSPSMRMLLEGSVFMSNGEESKKGTHGFEAQVRGVLEADLASRKFTRCDIVAIGDCWGGDWEGGRFARPGRAPLGVAFELAAGKSAAERVPPKGQGFRRELAQRYFNAERE